MYFQEKNTLKNNRNHILKHLYFLNMCLHVSIKNCWCDFVFSPFIFILFVGHCILVWWSYYFFIFWKYKIFR